MVLWIDFADPVVFVVVAAAVLVFVIVLVRPRRYLVTLTLP